MQTHDRARVIAILREAGETAANWLPEGDQRRARLVEALRLMGDVETPPNAPILPLVIKPAPVGSKEVCIVEDQRGRVLSMIDLCYLVDTLRNQLLERGPQPPVGLQAELAGLRTRLDEIERSLRVEKPPYGPDSEGDPGLPLWGKGCGVDD